MVKHDFEGGSGASAASEIEKEITGIEDRN